MWDLSKMTLVEIGFFVSGTQNEMKWKCVNSLRACETTPY